MRWHTTPKKATRPERWVLIYAEHLARQLAVQLAYEERLAKTGAIICDAHDLDVLFSRVEWARRKGNLYVTVRVYHRQAGGLRDFNWRCAMPDAANTALKVNLRSKMRDRSP
jgi:hypothetical protein